MKSITKTHVCIIFTILIALTSFSLFTNFLPKKIFADSLSESSPFITHEQLEMYISSTDIDKSAGSLGEKKTSEYIESKMQECNLSYFANSDKYIHTFDINPSRLSQNVIGVKKSVVPNAKDIIIGAHYDNTHSSTNASLGALSNGTGVVCLLSLMQNLKLCDLNFNVIYIFYGAGKLGHKGANAFVNSLSLTQKQNILLSINLDSIGCGENTYFYASHNAQKISEIFKFKSYEIQSLPIYRKYDLINNKYNFAFSNAGSRSDNAVYIKNDIKSLNFFSGNANGINAGFKESHNYENIADTPNDNPTTLLEYYPKYFEKIDNVCKSIFYTLTNGHTLDNLQSLPSDQTLDFLNNKIIIFAIVILGVLLLCGIKFENKKTKKE